MQDPATVPNDNPTTRSVQILSSSSKDNDLTRQLVTRRGVLHIRAHLFSPRSSAQRSLGSPGYPLSHQNEYSSSQYPQRSRARSCHRRQLRQRSSSEVLAVDQPRLVQPSFQVLRFAFRKQPTLVQLHSSGVPHEEVYESRYRPQGITLDCSQRIDFLSRSRRRPVDETTSDDSTHGRLSLQPRGFCYWDLDPQGIRHRRSHGFIPRSPALRVSNVGRAESDRIDLSKI